MPRKTATPQSQQIPLNLAPEPNYGFARFEKGPCNEAALTALHAYPDWPAPILALIGPAGSGKTHLAHAWADTVDAVIIQDETPKASWSGHPLVLDGAEQASEPLLFAVLNMALNGDVPGLLLTSAHHPAEWSVDLPDLRSRLSNISVAQLKDPDDVTLELIIRKLFADQGREVSRDLVTYLMAYQDRSVTAMKALIAELDIAASQNKSDLTKTYAARYLNARKNTDLFSD